MNAGYLQKGINGIIHKIMATAAMNMNIDKTRTNILPTGIYHNRFRRFNTVFAHSSDLAISHHNCPAIDDVVTGYDPAVKYFKLLFHKCIKGQFFLDKRS